MEDRLESDLLDYKLVGGQASCSQAAVAAAVVELQTFPQGWLEKTAAHVDHSTTGCRRLVHTARTRSRLGTSYQSGRLVRQIRERY